VTWLKDARSKTIAAVVAGLATPAIIAAVLWVPAWFTSIVYAAEMEGLASMIAAEVTAQVRTEIAPLKQQVAAVAAQSAAAVQLGQDNATDIKLGRIAATRQSIRDLTFEIEELQDKQAASPGTFSTSDALLLREWRSDLDVLETTLEQLLAIPALP
jgi:hypothetical protein